ncbi:hypothetical protein CCUS01_05587 [Colletotrichum cuscutae]|uniref:Uncharacterized protein n=1 Tax=Colletotrichum cuscutae TaxID=1209917 RepID=A0AAI9Y483_9PEZI|nr:hypothetical protein CCUS01_05587 [Colletotrichum cuscutae]
MELFGRRELRNSGTQEMLGTCHLTTPLTLGPRSQVQFSADVEMEWRFAFWDCAVANRSTEKEMPLPTSLNQNSSAVSFPDHGSNMVYGWLRSTIPDSEGFQAARNNGELLHLVILRVMRRGEKDELM